MFHTRIATIIIGIKMQPEIEETNVFKHSYVSNETSDRFFKKTSWFFKSPGWSWNLSKKSFTIFLVYCVHLLLINITLLHEGIFVCATVKLLLLINKKVFYFAFISGCQKKMSKFVFTRNTKKWATKTKRNLHTFIGLVIRRCKHTCV